MEDFSQHVGSFLPTSYGAAMCHISAVALMLSTWLKPESISSGVSAMTRWFLTRSESCEASGSNLLEERIDDLRSKYFKWACVGMSHFVPLLHVVLVFVSFYAKTNGILHHRGWFLSATCLLSVCYMRKWILLPRRISEALCVLLAIGWGLLSIWNPEPIIFFNFGPRRAIWRIFVSVVFLDVRKSCIANIVFSAAVLARFARDVSHLDWWPLGNNADTANAYILDEAVVFCGAVLASIASLMLHKTCLQAQLNAEQAQASVERLLSVLFDAVMHLGESGEIMKPTPQLCHLLQSGVGEVQGTHFVDHLSSADDERRFQEFMHNATSREASPAVLNVHIKHQSRLHMAVELFHSAHLDPQGKWVHLLGIREIAVDQSKEDETHEAVDTHGCIEVDQTNTCMISPMDQHCNAFGRLRRRNGPGGSDVSRVSNKSDIDARSSILTYTDFSSSCASAHDPDEFFQVAPNTIGIGQHKHGTDARSFGVQVSTSVMHQSVQTVAASTRPPVPPADRFSLRERGRSLTPSPRGSAGSSSSSRPSAESSSSPYDSSVGTGISSDEMIDFDEDSIIIGGVENGDTPWTLNHSGTWHQEEQRNSISLIDWLALPTGTNGKQVSFGSLSHIMIGDRNCKPCVQYQKTQGSCRFGTLCFYCHVDHSFSSSMRRYPARQRRSTTG